MKLYDKLKGSYYNNYQNYNFNNYNSGYGGGRFRQKIAGFMMGRYGSDQLSRAIFAVSLVLIILSAFDKLTILELPALILLGWGTFRIYSRNIYKRQTENMWYLKKTAGLRSRINARRNKAHDKSHIYVKCDGCGTQFRVPKHVGTIEATCPGCHMKKRIKTGRQL